MVDGGIDEYHYRDIAGRIAQALHTLRRITPRIEGGIYPAVLGTHEPLTQASHKVRGESMRINAEFDAIETDLHA